MWGDLSKGLSLESSFHQADMPVRSQKLEAYNFSEIVLTEESAIGIGSSVTTIQLQKRKNLTYFQKFLKKTLKIHL